jgi:hypothetical protein
MFVNDHPNAHLLERLYRKDADSFVVISEAFDKDFVCHSPGQGVSTREFVGLEAFLTHLAELDQLSAGTATVTPVSIYADDTWAIVPSIMKASCNGRSLDMAVAGFWRFSGPGRPAEHWEVVSDKSAWDGFWAQ